MLSICSCGTAIGSTSTGPASTLARTFGCARVVFNDGLRARQQAHAAGLPYGTNRELSARLTAVKRTLERAWLNEVSAVVLQQALADLNAAYRNFFASAYGRRTGPKVALPRFRSRKDKRQAIRFTVNARFRVLASGKLRLPKVGDVSVRWSRPLPSEPSSVTVIKDAADRYFASFVVDTDRAAHPETEQTIGIDLGLIHFVVLSDGRKIASPRFLRRAEKSSSADSVTCLVSSQAAATGRRPGSESPVLMRRWRMRGAIFTTSCPRR
jgi:transposase